MKFYRVWIIKNGQKVKAFNLLTFRPFLVVFNREKNVQTNGQKAVA